MILSELPRSLDNFCRDVDAVAAEGDKSKALQMVLDLVEFTIASEHTIANVLSSRQLDALCQRLGETALVVESFEPDRTLFVVTALYKSGGHSRVLNDLIRADPGKRVTVLVTNVNHSVDEADLRNCLDPGVELHIALANAPLQDVLLWTQQWIMSIRAERVYLLQHHWDPVIPAAVQPSLVKRLFYIHNCDHSLALGVHLPHSIHVDLHGKGFHTCRDREGVENNVCWPLVSQPGPVRSFNSLDAGSLRTATSGGPEKFWPNHLTEQIPYLFHYADMMATILKATGGIHHHIGVLPKPYLAEIEACLKREKLSPNQFVHVDFVPRLADFFVDNDIDLYVGSMPWGGGRALVEVMGSGLPVILHTNYQSVLLCDQSEAYPGVLTWRDYAELTARLTELKPVSLKKHAQASLAFYRERHRPEVLEHAIAATLRDEPIAIPERPVHRPDALQRFLDERAAQHGNMNVSTAFLRAREHVANELEGAYRKVEKIATDRQIELDRIGSAYRQVEKISNDRQNELDRIGSAYRQVEKISNDRQDELDRISSAYRQVEKISNDRQDELDRIGAAYRQVESIAVDRQDELDRISSAYRQVERIAIDRQDELDRLGAAYRQVEKIAMERQEQLDQLNAQLHDMERLALDRLAMIEALNARSAAG